MESGSSFDALRRATQDLNLLRQPSKDNVAPKHVSVTTKFDTNITEIESSEQTLIQHLRTAGIKKSRETELIDEVLHIRRLRRQLIAAITTSFDKLCIEHDRLRESSSLAEERHLRDMKRAHEAHVEEVSTQKKKCKDLEKKFRTTAKEMTSKYEASLATQVEKVKQKYEAKLQSLESMVKQVHQHEASEDAVNKIQEKYATAMQRYKSAMRSLMDREANLEQDLKTKLQQVSSLELENRKLQQTSTDYLNEIDTLKREVISYKRQHKEREVKLQASIDKCAAENMQLRDDLRSLENANIEALADVREKHATELNTIDDKVRQAMRAKDDIITKLRTQLFDAEAKLKQAEDFIAGINRDLTPAVTRR